MKEKKKRSEKKKKSKPGENGEGLQVLEPGRGGLWIQTAGNSQL